MVVNGVRHEPVRSGANRVLAKRSAGAVGHDLRQDQVDRERAERLLEPEDDRVPVGRVD